MIDDDEEGFGFDSGDEAQSELDADVRFRF